MQQFPRRTFIAGGLAVGAFALSGCGGGDSGPEVLFLRPTFPDGFLQPPILAAGLTQRVTFVVSDEVDELRETAPERLAIRIVGDGGTVAEAETEKRDTDIITPHYAIEATFATPGQYQAELPDFPDVSPVVFMVGDRDEVGLPQVGDLLPAIDTPTFDDARGVDPICTRGVPCPFHEINLADAVGNGRPTVVMVSTPGFCQSDICGPVLDLLITEAEGRTDLDVIHAEVYTDPSQFQSGVFPELAPAVDALGLLFEPSLFVAGADDRIVARLDTTFDRSEIQAALALV